MRICDMCASLCTIRQDINIQDRDVCGYVGQRVIICTAFSHGMWQKWYSEQATRAPKPPHSPFCSLVPLLIGAWSCMQVSMAVPSVKSQKICEGRWCRGRGRHGPL
jgi:hypothetical protein